MNTLKNEHLLPSEKPLYVSLSFIEDTTIKKILYILGLGRGVDWYSGPFMNKLLNNVNPEQDSYVISEVSISNKHSRGYCDCTGLVLIGKNSSGKNISLLTHQDSKYLFCRFDSDDCRIKFKNDLQIALDKFKLQVIPGTIDICIVGGFYVVGESEFRDKIFDLKENYKKSIELLNNIIMNNFGFSPVVVGPILESGFSDIYLDTNNRRITQKRGEKNEFTFLDNTIFQADKIEETIPELDNKCKI